jgi:hypothetical protein
LIKNLKKNVAVAVVTEMKMKKRIAIKATQIKINKILINTIKKFNKNNNSTLFLNNHKKVIQMPQQIILHKIITKITEEFTKWKGPITITIKIIIIIIIKIVIILILL